MELFGEHWHKYKAKEVLNSDCCIWHLSSVGDEFFPLGGYAHHLRTVTFPGQEYFFEIGATHNIRDQTSVTFPWRKTHNLLELSKANIEENPSVVVGKGRVHDISKGGRKSRCDKSRKACSSTKGQEELTVRRLWMLSNTLYTLPTSPTLPAFTL